ncbi:MAG TPA: bifunctional homocysteine S-methyltransferase/methylenetetrahydrofolate reductase [Vicinamibacterales bacterium]|nr:bifunctional homocysteine S-methyltransferase/methylenetetrahydrofolate reductase [Vicinamibacterales bacterium]
MRPPFLEALDRRVLVCDGAMGTMLYAKGVFLNRCFDELNVTQPDLVLEVHQAYVRAGAEVLETNTFGANRVKLASFGLADRLHAINVQGARIARHAARDEIYVAGAIGPLGIRIEPWGKTGVDEAEAFFREQAQALLEGGVDLFILETFRDLSEIRAAIRAVRALCALPVVAQMTTEEDGNSLDGTPPEEFAPALEAEGADVVGVNCSVGPAAMLETIERIARVTRARLSAQPNAGRPRDIEGRNIYLCSPEYMASYARRFIAAGVKLVGGCCGTTPEHIRSIRQAVRAMAPAPPERPRAVTVERPRAEPHPPVPREEKSRMANALARGQFVVAVELLPPRGYRTDALLEQARQLRIHGIDLVNVPDGPRATARMSALAVALLVQQHTGLEPILHYACRDRNLLGMQSDLLGAHAMGIRNLLIVTGDPPRAGESPAATGVFDVDSIGLTNVVARLNRGLDIGGQPIGQPTAFHIGVAANPTAPDLDREVRRFEYKVEAGAEFAVTQPIYDVAALEAFLARIAHVRIPILAGLVPFQSARHAEFLANEVPGVRVPEALVERMRRAHSKEDARAEGLAIAREVAERLRGLVQGLQIAAAPGLLPQALEIAEAVAG